MSAPDTQRKSPKPLGFHTYVTDAISEWEELYKREIRGYEEEARARFQSSLPYPGLDSFRSDLLKELIEEFFVTFEDWCPEEVVAFTMFSCPRQNLVKLTTEGETSRFLQVLHDNWKPSFLDWAYFLWEFTGRACELFADVLYLMPKPNKAVVGKALFKDMVEKELVPSTSCASFIGALIPHLNESTYARKHEEEIDMFSKLLGPTEIGLICRSIVLYRSRDHELCNCGYHRGEYECKCATKQQQREGSTGVVQHPLAFDLDKEYALVLMKLTLDRNGIQVLEDEYRWTQNDRDEFVRSACEEVFSEAVYTELYQNLHNGKEPVVKQRSPREITEVERKANVTRSYDGDYNASMAQHSGCISRGCKQNVKAGCANSCCKQHCRSAGLLNCKAHRMYSVQPEPREPHRKNINMRDERQRPGSRYAEQREGDEI